MGTITIDGLDDDLRDRLSDVESRLRAVLDEPLRSQATHLIDAAASGCGRCWRCSAPSSGSRPTRGSPTPPCSPSWCTSAPCTTTT
jgi:hypothetical protein